MSSIDAKAAAICAGAQFLIGFDVPHRTCAEDMQMSGEASRLDCVAVFLEAGVDVGLIQDLVGTIRGAGSDRMVAAWWSNLRPLRAVSWTGEHRVGVLFEPASFLVENGYMSPVYADIMAVDDPWRERRGPARHLLMKFRERLKAQAEGRP